MAAFLAPGITRRSLFGFAFVASLAVVGLFLLFDYNQTDTAKSDQVRLGNALQAELQGAALAAQRLGTLEGPRAEEARDRVRQSVAELRRARSELLGEDGSRKARGLSADSLALFLDPPTRIDENLRNYIDDLSVIANGDGSDPAATRAAISAVLAKAEPLRDSFADFVRQVEAERASNIRRLFYLLGAVLGAIVLLILAGGLGIVRPVLNASARTGRRLKASQLASERARLQILNALNSVRYAIALFDAADRLVVGNKAFHDIYRSKRNPVTPGTRYEALLMEVAEEGLVPAAVEGGQAWIQKQLERHNLPESQTTWRFADGRDIGLIETKTSDGGTVLVQHETAIQDGLGTAAGSGDAIAMAECALDALIKVDSQGRIQAANSRVEDMFGYSPEEAAGRNVAFFFVGRDFADFLNGGATLGTFYTAKGRNRDGGEFPLEVAVAEARAGARRRRADTSYVLTVRDIRGPSQLSGPLRQAQRMEAIGTLAGGVAHDFNNILSIIMGYSTLLKEELPEDGELRENLDMVEQASHRARDLVEQILAVSRGADPVLRPVLVEPVMREGLKLMRSTLPATIEIRQDIGAAGAKVLADPSQLQQVLMNLCTNGAHAIGDGGGVLEVSLKEVWHEAAPGQGPDDLQPGRYLKLSVRDDGVGMDAETAERVFEPFFTTKDRDRGSGLGLSVVHGMVAERGGAVAVDSAPGEGATFDVYLPVYDGDEPAAAEVPQIQVPKGRGRVLFVDDEEPIVRLGQKILGKLGYAVVGALGGEDALDLFRADPKSFDLVVTDQTMPGMTGETLIAEIRKLRGDIPAVLCTGYSQRMDEEEARALGIESFLMKPLEGGELGWAVARALNLAPAT